MISETRCVGVIHHSCTVTESRLQEAKYSGLTSIETSDTLRDLPLHVVKNWVGVGVGGDVLPVVGHPEGDHVLPERPGHLVLAQSVWLMLLSSPRAGHSDLHALVAVVCPERRIAPVSSPHTDLLKVSPHVGVEADIFLSKSLNEIFFGGDLEGEGCADQESNKEKLHPASFK